MYRSPTLVLMVATVIDAARLSIGSRLSPKLDHKYTKDAGMVPETIANFGTGANEKDMWFGLATAAAHVEMSYPNDPWVAWGQRGHVAAYKDSEDMVKKGTIVSGANPDMRLRFLEEPEVELDLAANTGVKVFRMGVEWGRLVPNHPIAGEGVQDKAALKRYREIILMAKERGMEVMLTLFHHSMPLWCSAFGGWLEENTVKYFDAFAKDVATELKDVVDYWVTFNEPHVYVLLSNCAGLWPPGPPQPLSHQLSCISGALPWVNDTEGGYTRAVKHIVKAHKQFYSWAHDTLTNPQIGVAHNVALNEAYSVTDKPSVAITESLFKFDFIDQLKSDLDWLGLNYYSKEIIGGGGPMIVPGEEYSESGRTIHPDGLLDVLLQFNNRFPQNDPSVSFKSIIITENGISDASDIFRPSYIVEHLLAVSEARHRGVPIAGYVHWTISDNWEWADGYCPKFGLVDVDRSTNNLTRSTRPSYDLYTDIVKTGIVTQEQRDKSWEVVREAILAKKDRPFCRADDGKTGLDEPVPRRVVNKDWRFSKGTQVDGGCYYTPWMPYDKNVPLLSHTSNGSCEVYRTPKDEKQGNASKDIPPSCRRAVLLRREKRCKDKTPEIETRGSVCEGARRKGVMPTNSCKLPKSKFGRKKLPCCCDSSGRCGYTLHTENT